MKPQRNYGINLGLARKQFPAGFLELPLQLSNNITFSLQLATVYTYVLSKLSSNKTMQEWLANTLCAARPMSQY